jgi:hypothetical protein
MGVGTPKVLRNHADAKGERGLPLLSMKVGEREPVGCVWGKQSHRHEKKKPVSEKFKEFFYGKICIPDNDPLCSTSHFRMVGDSQRAPGRMSQVDMTPFLIMDRITSLAERFYYVLAGKNGKLVRHISTATKVSFTPGR